MKRAMALILMVFILALAVAEAALPTAKHNPMKVRCKNKYFPCYNQELYCPASCPRTCSVDCNKCKAVCGPVPPLPPPPKFQKQMKVVCNDKRYRACYNKPLFCPVACSRTCTVNCASCQPVCRAVVSPPPSSRPKRVRCLNKKYPGCYYREFTCPAACPQTCQVDSATCSPVCNCNKPGAVCEDPRFIGADGITFYFHGKKDQDYCLLTDSNLHINAHFIGKRDTNMGRDFTWVQSLGILFDNHKLYIGAKNTTTWNDALDRLTLSYDNQSINLPETDGATWKSTAGEVTIIRSKSTNAVEIIAEGMFMIKAVVVPITETDSLVHRYGISPQDQDCFAHLDLRFKFYSLSGEVNGVLGQTYARNYVSRVKMGVANPVVGGEKEFHSSSMFATDCGVTRFNGNRNESVYDQGMDFSDLNCVSGTSGRGVVCKR